MIELRQLSYFVAACHQTSLSKTAEVLDIALSTLSVALENLERDVGAQLFRRVTQGLTPTVAGRWLYRAAVPVLQAEAYTRRTASLGFEELLPPLVIEMRLMFSLGNLSKAVAAALGKMQAECPNAFVEPHWLSYDGEPPLPRDEVAGSGRIAFGYGDVGEVIYEDPWVLAKRLPTDADASVDMGDMLAGPIIVPALPDPLMTDLNRYLASSPLARIRFVPDHPGTLARLTGEHTDSAFLLPRSILAHRMGLQQVKQTPLDPALVSKVRYHEIDPHPLAATTIEHIRSCLASGEMPAPFKPQLTRRQFHYFDLIDRSRNMTAASRAAKVAQPAITSQLRKMEQVIGQRLFERRRDGLVPTTIGRIFRAGSQLVNDRLQTMAIHSIGAVGRNRSRLRVGVLPSVSQESILLTRMTDAVLKWRETHPHIDLQILEAPTSILEDWVNSGTINLAVLETDKPHMARFSLKAAEPLSVISRPEIADDLVSAEMDLERLTRLPLILPTNTFGIRQLLDQQLRASHLSVEPAMEVNSLPMLIAMLKRTRFCTVLPESAVRRDLEQGTLVSVPISPKILRKLSVIYSNARELTAAERELVAEMRTTFSGL